MKSYFILSYFKTINSTEDNEQLIVLNNLKILFIF